MSAKIRFADSALADLEAIRAWYAEQGVEYAGARLVGDIVGCIEYLADHPEMGRVVPEFGRSSLAGTHPSSVPDRLSA